VASMPRLGLMIGPKVVPAVSPGAIVGGGPTEPIATALGSGFALPSGPTVWAGASVWPMIRDRTTPMRIVAESRQSWRRRSFSAARVRRTTATGAAAARSSRAPELAQRIGVVNHPTGSREPLLPPARRLTRTARRSRRRRG
jgi:hypothetical protein